MKTITKKITLLSYKELHPQAQEKAMENHVSWYAGIDWSSEEFIPDFIQQAQEKCEEMQTPWFFESYLLEYGEPHFLIELEETGEKFLSNGEIYYQDINQ